MGYPFSFAVNFVRCFSSQSWYPDDQSAYHWLWRWCLHSDGMSVVRWTEDLCVNQTVSRVHENAAVLTESSGETPTAMPSSRCRVDGVEVMIEPWWRRDATFDSCTAEDHRGAPSLRPIIVKMPKHDAATAKSWMLQQPMVVARVGGVAGRRSVGARRVAWVACGFFCPWHSGGTGTA